ncbi:hypothetical protein CYYG_00009 [Cyanophage SS120-1]|uniref:Uncharacterized protein n=1 Tax=Cyanophage SS120-1 TaxID=616674 RepID=M1UAA7_9CAUD|nr:hypothetical protein CYYG_00009 [Cyanophage SS120-1]AGG54511.1 hypothetical protein CYYG_00009 [Cyanophage SS120-1]
MLNFTYQKDRLGLEQEGPRNYSIYRHYIDESKATEIIGSALTLVEAEAHCSNPRARKEGEWFDSYHDELVPWDEGISSVYEANRLTKKWIGVNI